MIEIKTRGGMILYVAKDATDIRAAVIEATKARANLSGANLSWADLSWANLSGADLSWENLSWANLSGADLSGANLSGADLSGANLSGANLSGANLSGANLSGADLSGANLSGADLSGADLSGANLSGANLSGANLSGADWEKVATTLEAAIAVMNDGGRHWIKGSLTQVLADGTKAFCSVGGVNEKAADATTRSLALWLLSSVTAGSVENFNDYEGTSWEDVQAVFAVAIMHAKRFQSLAHEEPTS